MGILPFLAVLVSAFLCVGGLRARDYNGERSVGATDYEGELDEALGMRDYPRLTRDMLGSESKEHLARSLDWARARMMSGSSLIVPLLYATNLWRLGSAAPQDSKIAELKQSSAMLTLYAASVAFVDGQKCADETAPTHRLERIVVEYLDVLRFVGSLTLDRQKTLLGTAIAMESKTAALRGNDDYLCRFGAQQTLDYFRKHGEKGIHDIPPRPGDVGTQRLIPNDPTYEPSFATPDIWQPKQIRARGQLQGLLSGLVAKAASLPQAPVRQ